MALWVAKLSDTLLRRGDVNSAALINTDLNTYINAMTPRDQIVATMAKIDTHAQEGGNILEKVTYIAKELKSAALFIQKKMDMASDVSESFNQYIGEHTELEEIESHLLLSDISHRNALEVATNTRYLHQNLTNKVRNLGLTLPTDIEIRGVNLLVGREQKRVELEEILLQNTTK